MAVASPIRLLDCTVDLVRRVVLRPGQETRLTPTEARLLQYLCARPDRVHSQERLLEEVWGYRKGVQSRTVIATVQRLRGKIEADPAEPRHLLTVPGQGYRFRLAVLEVSSSLVGRVPDRVRLGAALADANAPVALVGPFGVGKTALATEHLQAARGRLSGAWMVDLSPLATVETIAEATARALGLVLQGARDPVGRVSKSLLTRTPCLLLLDNAEHIAEVAAEAALAWQAPGVQVLLTSRQPLPGCETLALDPLPEAEAERLLALRAGLQSGTQGLMGLACALDGLPLALELAAARLALLTPEELLARLNRRLTLLTDPRGEQRSLRAALDATWELLDEMERRALTRLSLPAGSFPLQAAEALLADLPAEPLDLVERLRARSLLVVERAEGTRLRLLQSVRSYAGEALEALGEAELVRARLRAWAVEVVEREAPRFDGPDAAEAGALLDRELELLLACFESDPRCEVSLRGVVALARPAIRIGAFKRLLPLLDVAVAAIEDPALGTRARIARGQVRAKLGLEALADLDEAVARAPDQLLKTEALDTRGALHRRAGRLDDAEADLDEALATEGLAAGRRGRLLVERAAVDRARGRHHEALVRLDEAQGLLSRARQPHTELIVWGEKASNARHLGELIEAETWNRRALKLAQSLHDLDNIAALSGNLANLCLIDGRLDEAERLLRQSLAISRRQGRRSGEAYALAGLGLLALGRGDPEKGELRTLDALAIAREVQSRFLEAYFTGTIGRIRHHRGLPGAALARYATAESELASLGAHAARGQFAALRAAALADLGEQAAASSLLDKAQILLQDEHKGPALLAWVGSFLRDCREGATEAREAFRRELGDPRLFGRVLW